LIFAEPLPRFGWQLESEIKGKEDDDGARKDLQREFLEAAALQGKTPEANKEIATALRKMLTEMQNYSPSSGTPSVTSNRDKGRSFSVSSFEAESFSKPEVLQTTQSIDLYYRRHEAHIKAVETKERRRKEHEDKIDSAMELLMSTLSISVRTTFKAEIPTRRLDYIWSKISAKCGPRSGIEGLSELSKEWAIDSGEQMTDFQQRLERTSTKFEAYGAQWHKIDEYKIVQVRQALMGDTKNWED
jgi:hypothetical protein